MDITSLNRDQLIQLLAQAQSLEKSQPSETQPVSSQNEPHESIQQMNSCKFVSKTKGRCHNDPECEWGFCSRHKRTLAGREAKDKWEREKNATNPRSTKIVEEFDSEEEISSSTPEETVKRTRTRRRKPARKTKKRVIMKNSFGRYEDPETHLLFRPRSGQSPIAYGVQMESGEVTPITKRLMRLCDQRGWDYYKDMSDEDDEYEEEYEYEYETD